MKERYSRQISKAITYRALELAIADNYESQQMRCPIHLSIGQEYWLPFIQDNIECGDRIFSSHRSHSMYMALDCEIDKMLAELHGHPDGCVGGKGGSMHLKDISRGLHASTPIVASSIPLAIGSALASQRLNEDVLTVSYFGDGACEEGVFHESLNLASVLSLPILFICENNLYSCNTEISRRQSSDRMTRFAAAHGVSYASFSFRDDLSVISDTVALAFTSSRQKPFFLEVVSNRIYQHCGHLIDIRPGTRIGSNQVDLKSLDPITCIMENDERLLTHFEIEYDRFTKIIRHYFHMNENYWANA